MDQGLNVEEAVFYAFSSTKAIVNPNTLSSV